MFTGRYICDTRIIRPAQHNLLIRAKIKYHAFLVKKNYNQTFWENCKVGIFLYVGYKMEISYNVIHTVIITVKLHGCMGIVLGVNESL